MQPLIEALIRFPQEIPDVGRTLSEALKVWILGGALLLVLTWKTVGDPWRIRILAFLVLVSLFNYGRWGTKVIVGKTDNYDLYHYYLNAKYFDELGYYDLYPAGILVDRESGGPHFKEGGKYLAQDAEGHSWKPLSHALEQGKRAKERFTPERWAAFSHDALHLEREKGAFDDDLWRQMIQDHGFNGTPAWVALAKPLASVVPIENKKSLAMIDVGLLGVGIGAIAWAYGRASALWLSLFLLTTYATRWPTISWAYLRYDYVSSLLVALALLKKGKHALAGVFAGHAAAVRLFPAMWLFGPGMRGLFELLGGKVNRSLVTLAVTFCLTMGGLVGLGAWVTSPSAVKTHLENMMDHNSAEQLSSRRIGLAVALPFRGDLEPKAITPEMKQIIDAQKPLRFAVALALLAGLAWALRKKRDDEAFAFGFVPFFLLTTASYYYLVVRGVLVALHAGDLDRLRNRVGLAALLGLDLFANWSEVRFPDHRVFLIGWLAWGTVAYILAMIALMMLESDDRKAPA